MLQTITIIAVVLAIAIAAVLLYATTKPDIFRVARSTTIKASPQAIFPLLSDLQGFTTWSPYEHKDPAMKREISSPSSGKGATYAWDGDKNVGTGKMTITDTAPPSQVTIKLEFTRPFEANNVVDFILVPKGDSTQVTWAMQGPNAFIGKVMSVFMNMDKMVGTDFEVGLANLKRVTEK